MKKMTDKIETRMRITAPLGAHVHLSAHCPRIYAVPSAAIV